MSGPLGLTQATAAGLADPSDLRQGVVSAVSTRGIDVQVGSGLVKNAAHLTSYNPAVGDTVVMISYANSWVVLGRAVGPGTPVDLNSPGLAVGNQLLDGMVLAKLGGAIATSTGATVVVPYYSVQAYHPPGHQLLLQVSYTWFCTVNGDVAQVQVYEGQSGDTLAFIDHPRNYTPTVSNFVTHFVPVPPGYGGVYRNFGLKIVRLSGSGTSQIEDHGQRAGQFYLWDLGDQSTIRTV